MSILENIKQKMIALLPSSNLLTTADAQVKPASYTTAGVVKLDPTYLKLDGDTLICDDIELVREKMVLVSDPYVVSNTIYTNGTAYQFIIKADSLLTPEQPLSTCILSSSELEFDYEEFVMSDGKITITTDKEFSIGDIVTIECFCTDVYGNMSNIVVLKPICRQVCLPPSIVSPIGDVAAANLSIVLGQPVVIPSTPVHAHLSTDWILRQKLDNRYINIVEETSTTDLVSKIFSLPTLLKNPDIKDGVSVSYTPIAKANLDGIVSAVMVTVSETKKYILTIDRFGNISKADGTNPESFTELPKSDIFIGDYEVLDMISSESIQPIYQDVSYSVTYSKYNTIHKYAYVLVKFSSTTTSYIIYRVDVDGKFTQWAIAGNGGHIPRKLNHSVLYRDNTDSDYSNTAYGDIVNYFRYVTLIGVNCENGYVEFYEPFINQPTNDNSIYPYGATLKEIISKEDNIDMPYGKYRFAYQFLVNDSAIATERLANVMMHANMTIVNSKSGFEIYKSHISETMTMNMYLKNIGHTWLSMDLYTRFISTGDSVVMSVLTSNANEAPYYKNMLYVSPDMVNWTPITTCVIVNLPDKYQSENIAIHLLRRTWTSKPTYYGVATTYIDGISTIIGVVVTTDLLKFYFSEYNNQYSTQIPMVLADKKYGSLVTDKYMFRSTQYNYDLQVSVRFNIADLGSSDYTTRDITVAM